MALKNKTHDLDRVAIAQRKPKQNVRTEHEREQVAPPASVLERVVAKPPAVLRPADILTLQRTIGNRAIQRMLNNQSRQLRPSASAKLIHRQTKEEESLPAKFEIIPRTENQTGLPDNLKAGIENLSGLAMDDVRVHYNSPKSAGVHALAYTQGTDIHVGPGQERHLPHEAWHLVQQKEGRVAPTTHLKGVTINDDARLEHEADVMGGKSLQAKNNPSTLWRSNVPDGYGVVVQRIDTIIINKKEYSPKEAAQALMESGQQGSRTFEHIMAVLTDKSLSDKEMTFRSFFALGWFVERQHDRITGLAELMMPRAINSIYDLEQTLDYLCGNRWWYVGGYAALLWLRELGLEVVPTDDLDIAIGGEEEHERVMKYFPLELWKEHTQKVGGYSVQFIGRSREEPARMHRFGSSNVLIPEIIIQGYSEKESEESFVKSSSSKGNVMGIGSLASMVAAAVRKKKGEEPKQEESDEESLKKQAKQHKREMRVKLLQSILKHY